MDGLNGLWAFYLVISIERVNPILKRRDHFHHGVEREGWPEEHLPHAPVVLA